MGTGAKGAVPPGGDDHVYSLDPETVDPEEITRLPDAREAGDMREPTFGGDTFDGNTKVRTPAAGGSLASRVDAFLAAGMDEEEDELELDVTGTRPPVAPAPPEHDDLALGPAGVGDGALESDESELSVSDEEIGIETRTGVQGIAASASHEDPHDHQHDDEPPTGVRPPSEPVPRDIVDDVAHLPKAAAASGSGDEDIAELDDVEIQSEATPPPAAPIAASAPPPPRPMISRQTTIGMAVVPPPIPRPAGGAPPPIPRPGTIGAPPPIPRPTMPIPQIPRPPASVPAIHVPPPSSSSPGIVTVPPLVTRSGEPSHAAPEPAAPLAPQLSDPSIPLDLSGDDAELIESNIDLSPKDDHHAPSSVEPTVAPQIPIEHHLEQPTAVDKALAETGEAALEKRAAELQRDLDRASDRAQIAGLAYELGELFERRLADEARAVKAFGRALQTDPSLRPNLWSIRRVFYRRGLWPNLMKLVDAELRFARTDVERADLLFEKGLVLGDKLGQPVEARAAFEQAVALDGGALAALFQLERLLAQSGDEAGLADVWQKLAAASKRPERKLVHLLDLIRWHAEQGEGGVAKAKELVAEAAALGVDGERVAAEALRVAELSGAPDEVLAALEQQAQLLQAKVGPVGDELAQGGRAAQTRLRVVAARRRQAQVARDAAATAKRAVAPDEVTRGHAERAWDYLQQALALAPGEPLLLADLADLAEELGRFGELAELVESWQAMEGDPARALMLSIRRADALLRGGQRDQAKALLASLEAGAPGFLPITALAERDALASGDWAALARAYAGAADAARLGTTLGPGTPHAADPAAAAALYVASAEIWANDVGGDAGDQEARAALGHALELAPTGQVAAAATQALVELHERAGRIDEAAAVLEPIAASAGDHDARAAALERLARLHRDHARPGDAAAAEKRLYALAPDDVRLAWRVDTSLAQLGLHAERVEHLAQLAKRDPDPARRGIALSTAARIAEEAGDRARAIELYRATLGVWPNDRYARAALVELLRSEERWDELVSERRAEAAELADGAGADRALREAAWVLEERLARPADAAAVYRELLDRAPDDPHALAGLIRARGAAGDRDGLISALEQRADAATGAPAVVAAVELALAQERAGRLDDALDSYRRARTQASDANSVGAMLAANAIIDLAVARGDTAARVEAMNEQARSTTDPRFAAALHEDIGWLFALVLEDFDQAAAAFEAALQAASKDSMTRGSAAIEKAPEQRGALLGAALVAARRG
ncbi:MAG TPA: hypothetical protein VL463_32070, partial [Kofleriaceae bacterium]|nr:hypothetical protein [Kofleriaceae bacterium]